MKITDIKLSDPIYIPFEQARHREIPIYVFSTVLPMTFLQVFTDEGITGISPTGGMAAIIENMLKPQVIGEDPLNTERIWDKMYWATLMPVEGARPS